MKRALSLLPRLLLSICLAMYGPLAMAGTGASGEFFSIEICADGGVATVQVDANGVPVERDSDSECRDCLTCCNAKGNLANLASSATPATVFLGILTERAADVSFVIKNLKSRPMPRGPPLAHVLMLTTPDRFVTDQTSEGYEMRGAGRPIFKDATA